MYIDSGADITLIPRQFGETLGLEIKKDEIEEIKGIGEKVVPVIIKKIKLRIGHKQFLSRVAWSIIEEVSFILGRIDVFDKFKVIFDEKNEAVVFED